MARNNTYTAPDPEARFMHFEPRSVRLDPGGGAAPVSQTKFCVTVSLRAVRDDGKEEVEEVAVLMEAGTPAPGETVLPASTFAGIDFTCSTAAQWRSKLPLMYQAIRAAKNLAP